MRVAAATSPGRNLNGYRDLIQSVWKNDLQFVPLFAAEKCLPVSLPHLEERLQPLQRVLHAPMDVVPHCFGSSYGISGHQNVGQIGMPPWRTLVRMGTSHAKPRGCKRVSLFNGKTQCRTARALGDLAMELLVCRQVKRLIRSRRGIHSGSQCLKLKAIFLRSLSSEKHCGLNLQRFPNDVMPTHILARGNAHAGAGSRPAFQQTLELQP